MRKPKTEKPIWELTTAKGETIYLKGRQAQVYQLLQDGPKQVKPIAEILGISPKHVMDTLRRMRISGVIERMPLQFRIPEARDAEA